MFQYIKGTVDFFGEDYLVIDNRDIGYKVYTSGQTITSLRDKIEKVMIYTQMIVREDDISVYGFSTREELRMFQLLMTVTGVGAKVALGILSSIPSGKLAGIIISEDISSLTKAQGVGKKTAQRIVLELKDKMDHKIIVDLPSINMIESLKEDEDEALSALIALGYGRAEGLSAISAVKEMSSSIEDLIKRALRLLAR